MVVTRQWTAILLVVACGGCDGNSDRPVSSPAEAGASGDGEGPALPEPNQCAEVLRLSNSPVAFAHLQRLQGGFMSFVTAPGELSASSWVVGNEQDVWTTTAFDASGSPFPAPFPAGTAAEPRAVFVTQGDESGTWLTAEPLDTNGERSGEPTPVLDVFARGTALNLGVTSLDGERVALANGHVAAWDPRLVLLEPSGKPVSPAARLLDTGDQPLFSCFALTGTASGVVASVVDGERLQLIELDAQGEVRHRATLETGGSCATVLVDAGEVFVTLPDEMVGSNSAHLVYRLNEGSLELVATLPQAPAGLRYEWVKGGAAPLIAIHSGPSWRFAAWKNGELAPLEGEFTGTRVPSADGRLFLASSVDEAPRVVEVACAVEP